MRQSAILCLVLLMGCQRSDALQKRSDALQIRSHGVHARSSFDRSAPPIPTRHTYEFEPPSGFTGMVVTLQLLDSAGNTHDYTELGQASDGEGRTRISVVFELPPDAKPALIRLNGADYDISNGERASKSRG